MDMTVLEYYFFIIGGDNLSEGVVGALATWAKKPGEEVLKNISPNILGALGAAGVGLKTKEYINRARHKVEMLKNSQTHCNDQKCKDMYDKEIKRAEKSTGLIRNTLKGATATVGSVGTSVGLMASGHTAGISTLLSVVGSMALDHLLKRGNENNFKKFRSKISALQSKTTDPKELDKIRRQLSSMDEKYMDWKKRDNEKKKDARAVWLAQKLTKK